MTGQNAVPLIVLSAVRDPAEAVNIALRRVGQPVQCTWLPTLRDLGDALTQINPQLVIHAADKDEELAAVIAHSRPAGAGGPGAAARERSWTRRALPRR